MEKAVMLAALAELERKLSRELEALPHGWKLAVSRVTSPPMLESHDDHSYKLRLELQTLPLKEGDPVPHGWTVFSRPAPSHHPLR